MKKNLLIEKVERNGLVVISVGIAFLYWHFDSLHPGNVFTRLFTVFLFVAYGVFTQYLINAHKCMTDALRRAHRDLLEGVGRQYGPVPGNESAHRPPGDGG